MYTWQDEYPKAMPIFYESFISGLKENDNTLMAVGHKLFGVEAFTTIGSEIGKQIKQFDTDICLF